MRKESTDDELIEAALAGREPAFDLLMQRYERFVYKLAYGFGRSHDNALDLSKTVFLKVYRKLTLFRGEASFRTWLAKVVYHEGVSWQRANRRHVEGHQEINETTAIRAPAAADQDRELLRSERRELVLRGMAGLNRRYRAAIELRYFHGLALREIAEVLGCSEGAAKNALFRGVQSLKSQLSGA